MMNIFPLQNGSFMFLLTPLEAVNKAAFRRVDWVSVGGTPLQGAVIPAPGIRLAFMLFGGVYVVRGFIKVWEEVCQVINHTFSRPEVAFCLLQLV